VNRRNGRGYFLFCGADLCCEAADLRPAVRAGLRDDRVAVRRVRSAARCLTSFTARGAVARFFVAVRAELAVDVRAELAVDVRAELAVDVRAELAVDVRAEFAVDVRAELGVGVRAELAVDVRGALPAVVRTELASLRGAVAAAVRVAAGRSALRAPSPEARRVSGARYTSVKRV
jgi:hypothetical protein